MRGLQIRNIPAEFILVYPILVIGIIRGLLIAMTSLYITLELALDP